MRIFYSAKKPYLSHAFQRIEEGLKLTAPPNVQFVDKEEESDINIRPIVNWRDFDQPSEKDICLQLCYLTAGQDPDWWIERWGRCRMVASYLDLPYNYLQMPLGYDPNVFYPSDKPKVYRALTTGYVDGPGGEVIEDVWKAFGNVIHIGKDFKLGKGYHNAEKVSDNQMRSLYQASEYTVSLRYIEGFELPVIEGAACGSLPVAFDLPCYTKWFKPFTLFVRPDHIPEDLRRIAQEPAMHVPSVTKFKWENVMKEFWNEAIL